MNEDNWSSESDYKDEKEMFTGDYISLKIPCSHEVWLKGHTKAITCLSIDKKGVNIFIVIVMVLIRIDYYQGAMIIIHVSGISIT